MSKRRRRISDLYWVAVSSDQPAMTPDEKSELADAMLDETVQPRDTLKYLVKVLRADNARLNAAIEETEEQREARRAKDRERQARHRLSQMSQDVTNVTDVTERDERDNRDETDTSSRDVTPTNSLTNQPTNKIPPKGPPRGRVEFSADFEAFWDEYPRKVGKGKAFDAFGKAAKSGQWPGIEAVIGAVRKARGSEQWRKEGGQFIPHPATWLNQMRWFDSPAATGGDEDFRISKDLLP